MRVFQIFSAMTGDGTGLEASNTWAAKAVTKHKTEQTTYGME
jgi:hypothetical protein